MTTPPGALARLLGAAALALVLAGCASAPPSVAPDALPPAAPVAAAPAPVAVSAPVIVAESAVAAAAPAASAAQPAATPAAPEAAASAAGVPTDPLSEQPVDLGDSRARGDLWLRVRAGFAIPDLDTAAVRGRERYYADKPDYVQRMTERSSRYLFHIVEEVEKRGLPTELALLPFIESAFNPQALSRAKASGMWQFMPRTGKHFDLAQNAFRDERRDVLASTQAALDYLEKLHGMFGDWHLALAAYNWGEGSVSRAIAKNRRAGKPTDYLSLKMPAETRLYVPKLQAVENIVARPEAFGLALPAIENHPYFVSVPIQRDIDVELVAELAGLDSDEFHALNPSLKQPVILAAGTPQVLLPYDNADRFVRALERHPGPLASWTAWQVPATMRTAQLAEKLGMDEAELREVNRIPPRMLVRAGSTLLVPRNGKRDHDVSEQVADNATMLLSPDGLRRATVRARKNESVTALAQRLRLSAASVAQWNDVGVGSRFRSGQPVIVYLPVKNKAAKATRATAGAKAKHKRATRSAGKSGAKSSTRRTAAGKKAAARSPQSAQAKRRVAKPVR